MKKVFIYFLIFFVVSCGESSHTLFESSPQTITKSENKTTIKRLINMHGGGNLIFEDGSELTIPAGALYKDTEISISKDNNNSSYEMKPDGLISRYPMTLKIQISEEVMEKPDNVLNILLVSKLSPKMGTESEYLNAEKLLSTFVGNLIEKKVEVSFSHFSLIRATIQDPLYISFFLPAKYLSPADIIMHMTDDNFSDNTDFDWFPGHTGMMLSSKGEPCVTKINDTEPLVSVPECDLIESAPDYVREWNLDRSMYQDGHLYMGARRPKDISISDDDRNSIIKWSRTQIGKRWRIINGKEDSEYNYFSCVGLVESSYESVGKGMLLDFALNPPWPLDMYEETEPVNAISEEIGNTIEFQINPVYRSKSGDKYYDYRDITKSTPSKFSFVARNLPEGAQFNLKTGMFQWKNIPQKYAGKSKKITFRLEAKYGLFWTSSVEETLTINVKGTPIKIDYVSPDTSTGEVSKPTIFTVAGSGLTETLSMRLNDVGCNQDSHASVLVIFTCTPTTAGDLSYTIYDKKGGTAVEGGTGTYTVNEATTGGTFCTPLEVVKDESCGVSNGTGIYDKQCSADGSSWNTLTECVATNCDENYTLTDGACVEDTTTPTCTKLDVFTGKQITETLQRGDRDGTDGITQVAELQNFLNQEGYDAGTADGIFGSGTEAAVKAYQSANSLGADGIVGPNTRAVINASCDSN